MARKYHSDNNLIEGVSGIVLLFVIYLFGLWKTNRINFWLYVIWGTMFFSAVGIVYILWTEFKLRKRKKLLSSVREAGAEEDI